MTIYLIKSTICLLILLLFYRLVLQQEAIFHFNRFFLILSIWVSFLIPLYSIETAQEILPMVVSADSEEEITIISTAAQNTETRFKWEFWLMSLYLTVTAGMLIRFLTNLGAVLKMVRQNQVILHRGEKLVLLEKPYSPFSFFNYIFASRADFEKCKLTDAIWLHETTHVREKHSLDIIMVEVLLVLLWFHPGIYWARAVIKLNHEFLADQAALQKLPLENYQMELYSMLLSNNQLSIASSFNFTLTKKRIEMMQQKSKDSLTWFKILALIPLLGGLLYTFSERVTAQEIKPTVRSLSYDAPAEKIEYDIELRLLQNGEVQLAGQPFNLSQLPQLIKEKQRNDREISVKMTKVTIDPKTALEHVNDLQNALFQNGISHIYYEKRDSPGVEKQIASNQNMGTKASNNQKINSLQELSRFLSINMRYPQESRSAGEVGTVVLFARVNADGNIQEINDSPPIGEIKDLKPLSIYGYQNQETASIAKNVSNDHERLIEECKRTIKIIPKIDISEVKGQVMKFEFHFDLR